MVNIFKNPRQFTPKNSSAFALASVIVCVLATALFAMLIVYYKLGWDCALGEGNVPYDPVTKFTCKTCSLSISDSFKTGDYDIQTTVGLQDSFDTVKNVKTDVAQCTTLLKAAFDHEPEIAYMAQKMYEFSAGTPAGSEYCEIQREYTWDEFGEKTLDSEYSLCGCDLETYYRTFYADLTPAKQVFMDGVFADCGTTGDYTWYSYDITGYANLDAYDPDEPSWHNTFLAYSKTENIWDEMGAWCLTDSKYLFYENEYDSVDMRTDCTNSSLVTDGDKTFDQLIEESLLADFTSETDNFATKMCRGYAVGQPVIKGYIPPFIGTCFCDQCPNRSITEVLTLAIAGTNAVWGGLLVGVGAFLKWKIGYNEPATADAAAVEMATKTPDVDPTSV